MGNFLQYLLYTCFKILDILEFGPDKGRCCKWCHNLMSQNLECEMRSTHPPALLRSLAAGTETFTFQVLACPAEPICQARLLKSSHMSVD